MYTESILHLQKEEKIRTLKEKIAKRNAARAAEAENRNHVTVSEPQPRLRTGKEPGTDDTGLNNDHSL